MMMNEVSMKTEKMQGNKGNNKKWEISAKQFCPDANYILYFLIHIKNYINFDY